MTSQAQRRTWQRIVVGVDGSDESRAALRWAAEEAEAHGADMEAVYAVTPHRLFGAIAPHASQPMPVVMGEPGADTRRAEPALAGFLQQVFDDRVPPRLKPLVVEGKPAAVLLAQALDADLLVIGSRGDGGFKELLVGSVAEQCVRHARSSVVVVKPRGRTEAGGR
jgi:nucleotide-binding universal stress UspA family protein